MGCSCGPCAARKYETKLLPEDRVHAVNWAVLPLCPVCYSHVLLGMCYETYIVVGSIWYTAGSLWHTAGGPQGCCVM
eukprot:jgi/Mesvir1/5955/Mv25213-RA.1